MHKWRERREKILRTYRAATASYPSQARVLKFIISGGTATAVNLGTLFILTRFMNVWYLLSSVLAFMAAFAVSFLMQKLWTFGDSSKDRWRSQALVYFVIMLVGLGINTALIFIFVEYMYLHYLLAQFISGIFIAIMNFFAYRNLVFKNAAASGT